MHRRGLRKQEAATLVEVIVALSVVLILVAIVAPVLSRARKSAGDASEIASLRQIGEAAGLYKQDHDDEYPARAARLVEGGILSNDVLSSVIDPTPEGIANRVPKELGDRSSVYNDLVTSYRNSFLALGDWALDPLGTLVEENAGGGYFVSLSDWEPGEGVYSSLTSDRPNRYMRLLKDGSVHRELYTSIYIQKDGRNVHADSPVFLYVSESDSWKSAFVNQ